MQENCKNQQSIWKIKKSSLLAIFCAFFLPPVTAVWAACSSPSGVAGEVEYFSGDSLYKFCNGTDWLDIAANATATSCSNDRAIDYNPLSDNKRAFCRSGNWHTMDCTVTSDSCSTAGQVEYNTGDNMLQYCNGSVWVDMATNSGCCGGGGTSSGPYWVSTAKIGLRDQGVDVVQTPDGGFVVVGRVGPNSDFDTHVVKISATGTRVWSYIFDDTSKSDVPTDMMVTSTGDIVIVGHVATQGSATPFPEYGFIVKLNSSGTQQWAKKFGGPSGSSDKDSARSVFEDSDGKYVITGYTGERNSVEDSVVLKFSTSGTLETSSYDIQNDSSGYREQNIKMIPLSSGGYVVVGQPATEEGSIVKLNSSGAVTNARKVLLGGTKTKRFDDVIEASNGDIIMVGGTHSRDVCGGNTDNDFHKSGDAFIVRMSSDLSTVIWSKCIGDNRREKYRGVVEVPCTGDIIAVGYTSSGPWVVDGLGESDGMISKFDSDGNEIWTRTITHNGGDRWDQGGQEEQLEKVIIADDGSIVAIGNLSSSNGGSEGSTMIAMKLDLDGTVGGNSCSFISSDLGISESSSTAVLSSTSSTYGSYSSSPASSNYTWSRSNSSGSTTFTRQCYDP